MEKKSFTANILADNTPSEVFAAINNVRGWWSEDIEGNTDNLNEVFLYHYKNVHICKMKIVEFIPGEKVVWLVMENYFNFIKDQSEWKDTKIIFEIQKKGGRTELNFTHLGLVPDYECYNVCHDAWSSFIKNSLYNLITTGKGQPNPKDGTGEINAEVIQKWNLK